MSPSSVYARFAGGLSSSWLQSTSGTGFLRPGGAGLLLGNDPATDQVYTNAQIDDYRDLSRADFLWRPPLRLTLRARFSHDSGQITGTAGFGFWNDPLRMTGLRRLALPQALWFFYAGPDADMRMALDQPGWGWKAAVVDTRTCRFLARAPLLALAPPLMRVHRLYRWLWPSFQRQRESPNDCSLQPCRTGTSTPSTGGVSGHAFFWMEGCCWKHPMRLPVHLGLSSGWTTNSYRLRLGVISVGDSWRRKKPNGWRSTGWRSKE